MRPRRRPCRKGSAVAQQKRKTTKADATRRQLLDAALAVIAERGYAEATVDRIVEVAGVSKGVAYYHFASKADIAESILVEGIGDLIASFEVIATDAPASSWPSCGARAGPGPRSCASTSSGCWGCWRPS